MTSNQKDILLFLLEHDYYNRNIEDIILMERFKIMSKEDFESEMNPLLLQGYIEAIIRPIDVRCWSTTELGKKTANELRNTEEEKAIEHLRNISEKLALATLENVQLNTKVMKGRNWKAFWAFLGGIALAIAGVLAERLLTQTQSDTTQEVVIQVECHHCKNSLSDSTTSCSCCFKN